MSETRIRIETRLQERFAPTQMIVTDDSHLHAGHAGARPGGNSHFTVDIVSPSFAGLTRIACHRLVNEALDEELAGPVHALVIKARAPSS
jgi:BolA protein